MGKLFRKKRRDRRTDGTVRCERVRAKHVHHVKRTEFRRFRSTTGHAPYENDNERPSNINKRNAVNLNATIDDRSPDSLVTDAK